NRYSEDRSRVGNFGERGWGISLSLVSHAKSPNYVVRQVKWTPRDVASIGAARNSGRFNLKIVIASNQH
ncbi:hypothetical protein, partial [Rhodococcoides yunnanense]|uniref:hypothetical protein n=1 Tax=Rhodococcoides yunnanense TaxID=278209 RepID=UPI0022B1C81B